MRMRRICRSAALAAWLALLAVSTASAAGTPLTYTLDASKSTLEFAFVQAGANNKGRFAKFSVSLTFADDNLAASKLDVSIDTAALDTGDQERDDTLKDTDLFDVKKFPQARYTATQLTKSGAGYAAAGSLLLRGVTKPQRIEFTLRSATEQGRRVLYLTGKSLVKRLDYGVGQGDWKSTEWVGNDVAITFNLRLIAPAS
jgi:polyisoprenoid-binding protein YceI